ncbi:TVP38/TMEM64 family protein [Streptomyces sp. NBC_00059]|uniref:TVP38/TMEM64 family protein n=1 Tax=Streptomyces sp. NBC_00059 TaxID=2975635 RepID=UPI0022567436|nr:TVP38/TMEM64 family protein [Streptomyces sp. NBC_00059]MCX5417603.1 TVP38/TMEM64 family protein [Streptomyces sp. NBC_00059]
MTPSVRLGLLVVVLAAAAGSLFLWSPQRVLSEGFTSGDSPAWAGLGFVLVFAAGTLAFFPKPVLNVAAGVLFGAPEGVILAVAGTTLGAVLAFVLGRGLGREALRPFLKGKMLAALDRRLTSQGFRTVFLLRVVPGVPFPAVNFAAAFSGVPLRSFAGATALGVLPGTAAYVVAGASASSPTSPAFLISVGVMVALTALTLVSMWRSRRSATAPATVHSVA